MRVLGQRGDAALTQSRHRERLSGGACRVTVSPGTDPLTDRQPRHGKTVSTEQAAQIGLAKLLEQDETRRPADTASPRGGNKPVYGGHTNLTCPPAGPEPT